MNLNTYIKNLQELVKEDPTNGLLEVVYSKDDEGNEFQPVYFKPSLGFYEDREFRSPEDSDNKANSVCIN